MWFLCYLWLMNAFVSQLGFQNKYRISVGITQIGIVEISLAMGVIYILCVGAINLRKYPSSPGMHPALKLMLAAMAFSNFTALMLALVQGVDAGSILRVAREYLAVPACLLFGYFCIATPKTGWRFIYAFVLSGCCTAAMLLISFNEGAEKVSWGGSWNSVRTVNYVSAIAGLASIVCFYSLVDKRVRFAPVLITVALGGFCILGIFAPMHRSDWVAITLAYLAGIPLLPKENRMQAVARALVVIPVVSLILFAGVQIGSRWTNRDYGEVVINRIISILPTERKGTEAKAWDTRVGSMQQELDIWFRNPVVGNGYAIQMDLLHKGDMADTSAYFHNGWASVGAQMGLPGLVWVGMIVFCPMVVGFRLARDGVDRASIWIGFVSYCASFMLLVSIASTLVWTSRTSMCYATLFGMMFRMRDMQATTLAMRAQEQQHDETWLYEHGYYDAEGGWLAPGQF